MAEYLLRAICYSGQPRWSTRGFLSRCLTVSSFSLPLPYEARAEIEGSDVKIFSEIEDDSRHRQRDGINIWLIPMMRPVQSNRRAERILRLIFIYNTEEYIDFTWTEAVKEVATGPRLPCVLHKYVELYVGRVWQLVNRMHSADPKAVDQLVRAYSALGSLEVEIVGWWQLFENHPINPSFLKNLRLACVRKYHLGSSMPSLLHFLCLCFLHFLSQKAKRNGLGRLDWWPLARYDEFTIFQPVIETRRHMVLLHDSCNSVGNFRSLFRDQRGFIFLI